MGRTATLAMHKNEHHRSSAGSKDKQEPKYLEELPSVFRTFDTNLSGWISLREFDTRTYDVLAAFTNWCRSRFGGVVRAFSKLDKDGDKDMGRSEFKRALEAASSSGLEPDDADLLFEGLDYSGERSVSTNEVRFLDDWNMDADREEE